MKKRILWCGLSFLLVAALALASCAAEVGEQEEEEEEEEEQEEEEEEEPIVEDIVTIGQWVDEAWPGGAIITMTHENESIIVDTEFNDGSRHREEMVEETVAGQQRFYVKGGSTFNDYYVINTKGDLDIYDDAGYIRTAYLEDGVVITATPGEQEEEEDPEPEPEPTPPTSEIGYSRGNPATVGTELYIEDEFLGSVSELNITLLEVIRGEEAWCRIEEANMFNDPAPLGFEHILVKIRVEYLKGPTPDTTYDISPVWFDVISSEGKELERASEVPPDPDLSSSIYPGATHEGWGIFQVEEQDNKPLLTFGRDYKGSGGIWWQLY